MIHVHLAIPDDVGIQGMTLFSMATAGLRLRVSWYSGLPFAILGRPLQMGFTYLTVFVANPADRSRGREVEFLVDSGCFYTMVPRTILEEIGVDPVMEQTFTLANGDEIRRQVGLVYLFYKDRPGGSLVIFAEEGDQTLLGVLGLESMGYKLDPVKGDLEPIKLFV